MVISGAVTPKRTVKTTTTSTTTTTWRAPAQGCVNPEQLTLRQQLASLVMVNVGEKADTATPALLGKPEPPGGLVFTGTTDQTLAAGTLAPLFVGHPTLIAADDEGGRVTAVGRAGFPSARVQTRDMTPPEIAALAAGRAQKLRAAGVSLDFAPVLDISSQPDNGPIGDRSYGQDAETVVRSATAFASGLRQGGVLPAFKHFPGHGRVQGDSHLAVVTSPSLADLQGADLIPYRRLLPDGPAAVLIGHIDVPGLTEPNTPASLSPAAYQLLRTDIGFQGLAVTDDLGGMAAVSSRVAVPQAAALAIEAGADMAMVAPVGSYDAVLTALEEAVTGGRLPRERVAEALGRVRAAQGCS